MLGWARMVVALALLIRLGGVRTGLPSAGALLAILLGLHLVALARRPSATTSARRRWQDWIASLQANWFIAGLASLVVVGVIVRLPWAGFGLGHNPIDVDERHLAQSVLEFFRSGALPHETAEHHPGILYWLLVGSFLVTYVSSLVSGLSRSLDQIPLEVFVFTGRLTNILLAAGAIAIVGLIGKRLSGPRVGLLAAGVFGIAPLSVETSTLLRNDVAEVLLVVASVYVALELCRSDSRILPALAGGLAGLATGVKYTAVFVILPVAGAAALRGARAKSIEPIALALVAFCVVLGATNHFLWFDFPNFSRQLANEVAHSGRGHWAATDNPGWFFTRTLAEQGVGALLVCLSVGFFVFGLVTWRAELWVFLAFPVTYIWFMTQQPAHFPRWVYPLVPFVAVAGCSALDALVKAFDALPRRRWFGVPARFFSTALIILAVWPALVAGATGLSRALARPTHELAETSVRRRAAPRDRILLEEGWLDLRNSGLRVTRVRNLEPVLTGGLYQLQAYDWIVVPETRFQSAGLERLALVEQFVASREFGASPGVDFRLYRPPSLTVSQTSTDFRLANPEAAPFLGFEWRADASGKPGLALPANGGHLFLPLALGADLRFELELIQAGKPGGPIPISVRADGRELSIIDVRSDRTDARLLAAWITRPTIASKVTEVTIRSRRARGSIRVVRFSFHAPSE